MATKSAIFARQLPDGTFAFIDEAESTGNVWFVHSGTGTDAAGYGQNPNAPTATIDYAIGLCTAAQNDRIVVMPGHAETISAAAGIDADVAGITILGLGNGSNRPRVTMDTIASVDVDIDAANITIKGIDFVAGVADIVAAIDVNAQYFTMEDCGFYEDTDLNFKICVQDGATTVSSYMTLRNNRAICPDAANTHFVNFAGTGEGCRVIENELQGDWGTMAIGGAGIVTHCVVTDNLIANAASTNDGCINFAATATGIVARNLCAGAAAQGNGITATAMLLAGNEYGVISEDLSAILDPIAT